MTGFRMRGLPGLIVDADPRSPKLLVEHIRIML
jgi:hypothetical protein